MIEPAGEARTPTPEIEEFLSDQPEAVRRIAESLRQVILDVVPEAVEQLHGGWNVIGYSRDGSMSTSICAIAPHSRHVNLQFFDGVSLSDPEDLLEGTGKRARHVKLHRVEECLAEGVRELIREAAGRMEP